MIKKVILCVFVICFTGCVKDSLRYSLENNLNGIRITIGYIEDRCVNYSPYISNNFSDMLEFELASIGYKTILIKNTSNVEIPVVSENKQLSQNKNDLDNILPASAISANSQENTGKFSRFGVPKYLYSDEIAKLAINYKFDYYVQGSISQYDTGELLNQQSNGIILLEVYNKDGLKIGSISYTIGNASFEESDYLKTISSKIADKIGETIK